MNNKLKTKILELKDKLERGDIPKIVEKVASHGIKKHDVYNIINGKALSNKDKVIVVMREVTRCIEDNKQNLENFEKEISTLE